MGERLCVFTYRNDNVVETVEEGSELAEEPRTDGLEVQRINRRSVESPPKSPNCSPTVAERAKAHSERHVESRQEDGLERTRRVKERSSSAHGSVARSEPRAKNPLRKRTYWKSSVEKRYLLNRMTEDERAI